MKVGLKSKQTTNKEQIMDINTVLQQQKDFWKDECMKLREENKKLKEMAVKNSEIDCLKDTITSLKSSVVDLREARDMRDYKIKQLQHDAELTKEFWSCLMDCRDNPDDPSKDEIDDWCDSYDKSDEIRYHIYTECGIEDESSEEESSEEEEL